MIKEINQLFKKKKNSTRIIIFYVAIHFIVIVISPILLLFEETKTENNLNVSSAGIFLLIVVIFPFIETLIFQHFVIRLMYKFIHRNCGEISIVTSAALFGIYHSYNLGYIIYAFFTGIILAYIYVFYFDCLKSSRRGIITTTLIHSLRNLTAVIFSFYF